MDNVTINKVRKVIYVALEFATGVSDFVVTVRKPDGSVVTPAPVVTEQGDGVYTFEYTPDVVGVYQERVVSVVNGDKAIRSVRCVAADVEDVKTQVNTIEGKVDTVGTKVDAVDTKVTAVDGKVDAVDAKVTTVDGKVDAVAADVNVVEGKVDGVDTKVTAAAADVAAVKAKTDNLPADTAAKLQEIKDSVTGIGSEMKPGGYFA